MKKTIHNLYILVFVTLLFTGCKTTIDRVGYEIWPYGSIIKNNNTLYIPIKTYHWDLGNVADASLYKLQSNSLIKTIYTLKDFASSLTISQEEESKFMDSGFHSLKRINVDNEFHRIVINITKEEEYLVMENDSTEKIKLDEYIRTYYQGRINFKEILSAVRLKMPADSNDYYLEISLYPEGLYIIYPSKETVDYKSKTTDVSIFDIDPSSDPKGYYVSYYRYYPLSNPINFTEVKLPFLIDIENM